MLTPCQISSGPSLAVEKETISYLQKQFCPQARGTGGCFCSTCSQIATHQFYGLTWVAPASGSYVLKDIEKIFSVARFALDDDQKHFFVLERAHTLSRACANRLLKILEEPPAGYYFLLLTENYDALLPTIQSRGTRLYTHEQKAESDRLLSFFLSEKLDAFTFEKELKATKPSRSEANLVAQKLPFLLDYTRYTDKKEVETFLRDMQKHMPMPGGTLLFLKTLFLGLSVRRKKL